MPPAYPSVTQAARLRRSRAPCQRRPRTRSAPGLAGRWDRPLLPSTPPIPNLGWEGTAAFSLLTLGEDRTTGLGPWIGPNDTTCRVRCLVAVYVADRRAPVPTPMPLAG
jgi:hypothetical protein